MFNDVNFVQVFFSVLPALVVAFICYYFFSNFIANENQKRDFMLRRENSKTLTPLRLQAMERMTLFLERIDPGSLLVRIKPYNDSKHDYENLLIQNIETEFEHNLAQQIYISDACWHAIKATKSATISLIRQANMSDKVDSPDKLREVILTELIDKNAPSTTGIAFIKKEARELF
ncbi:MAG: hypothetical protein ACTJGD_06805 [Mesonia hippocampi]|uniref:DUF7935 family protein n=1 Tax=Mesonia hippocampi TaxID=1628250 RepID=UPI003F9A5E12